MKRAAALFLLLAFAPATLAAQTPDRKKFAHLTVEAWDAKTCVLIAYSLHNHAHFVLRCALPSEIRKDLNAMRGLHGPAIPVEAGMKILFFILSKTGDGEVKRALVLFHVERTVNYLAIEPQGKCPAGIFHYKSSELKSRS